LSSRCRLARSGDTKDLDIGGLHLGQNNQQRHFAAAPNVPGGVIVFSWIARPRARNFRQQSGQRLARKRDAVDLAGLGLR
jgi:hypothetical protein